MSNTSTGSSGNGVNPSYLIEQRDAIAKVAGLTEQKQGPKSEGQMHIEKLGEINDVAMMIRSRAAAKRQASESTCSVKDESEIDSFSNGLSGDYQKGLSESNYAENAFDVNNSNLTIGDELKQESKQDVTEVSIFNGGFHSESKIESENVKPEEVNRFTDPFGEIPEGFERKTVLHYVGSSTLIDSNGKVFFPVYSEVLETDPTFGKLSLSARGLIIQLQLLVSDPKKIDEVYPRDERGDFVRQGWDELLKRLCEALSLREYEANATMVELISQGCIDLSSILSGPVPSVAERI